MKLLPRVTTPRMTNALSSGQWRSWASLGSYHSHHNCTVSTLMGLPEQRPYLPPLWPTRILALLSQVRFQEEAWWSHIYRQSRSQSRESWPPALWGAQPQVQITDREGGRSLAENPSWPFSNRHSGVAKHPGTLSSGSAGTAVGTASCSCLLWVFY